jgi:hypothetical protein
MTSASAAEPNSIPPSIEGAGGTDPGGTDPSTAAPDVSSSARSCACGMDIDGMKQTRDDLINRIKKASSPRTSAEGDDSLPNMLSSLYSCAGEDLDEEDDPLPVRCMAGLEFFLHLSQTAHIICTYFRHQC